MIPEEVAVLLQESNCIAPAREHDDACAARQQISSQRAANYLCADILGQAAAPDSQRLSDSTPRESTVCTGLDTAVQPTDLSLQPQADSSASLGSDGLTAPEIARPVPIRASHNQPHHPLVQAPPTTAHPSTVGPQHFASDPPGSDVVGVLSPPLQPEPSHTTRALLHHTPEESILSHHDTSPALPRRLAIESYSPPRHSSPLSNAGLSSMPPHTLRPSNMPVCRQAVASLSLIHI